MAKPNLIFKILHREQWVKAQSDGVFAGAEIDRQDGFIHFSAAHQVEETANRHFAGKTDLLLVAFDPNQWGDALKWEISRGGDSFPHLYGTLQPEQAVFVKELFVDSAGHFQFPDLNRE